MGAVVGAVVGPGSVILAIIVEAPVSSIIDQVEFAPNLFLTLKVTTD